MRTESTKGKFWWWVSSLSNTSTLILQMILNIFGQSLIIICLTQSLSATGLGCGNALTVSEYPGVGSNYSSSMSLRYSLAWLGFSPLALYCSSSPFQHALLFHTWCKCACNGSQMPASYIYLGWITDMDLFFAIPTFLLALQLKTKKEQEFLKEQVKIKIVSGCFSDSFGMELLPGMYSSPVHTVFKPESNMMWFVIDYSSGDFSSDSMITQDDVAGVQLDGLHTLGVFWCVSCLLSTTNAPTVPFLWTGLPGHLAIFHVTCNLDPCFQA